MKKRDRQLIELSRRLGLLGLSLDDQESLRRIEMTLHRWSERECNGEVERDEQTGKTYATYNVDGPGPVRRYPVPDKETGALKRLDAIMTRYPLLWSYYQSDPRGCALYVGRKTDLPEVGSLSDHFKDDKEIIDSYYSSRGVAVCL